MRLCYHHLVHRPGETTHLVCEMSSAGDGSGHTQHLAAVGAGARQPTDGCRLLAIAALFLACLLMPGSLHAQAPLHSVSLEPAAPAGFVALSAYTLNAELSCSEGTCAASAVVRYRFVNMDRVANAELQLRLEHPADVPVEVSFEPALNAVVAESWELVLAPQESTEAVLRYRVPVPGQYLIQWAWDPAILDEWGTPGSIQISFSQPIDLADDAYL